MTVQSEVKKNLMAQAVLEYHGEANIVVKVDSDEEHSYLGEMKQIEMVDSNYELSSRLVDLSLKHLK